MVVGSLLLEIGLLFTGLAVAGTLASWTRQSVIPFYIVAGLILGVPGLELGGVSLGLVTDSEFVTGAAELGVVLLLFFLGLEFSFSSLLGNRARILKAGGMDLAINVPLGFAIGWAFGFTVVESLFLAGIVYISSSAVITKSLIDLGWIANEESETILGVLVFEDLFIAFFLSLLSAVALGGGGVEAALLEVSAAMLVMGLFVVLALFGARWLGRAVDIPSDELTSLRALAVTVLGAGLAVSFGLSEAVAAFFVGMAFSETQQVDRLERVIGPLKDLFGAVFFFWIGLRMDPGLLLSTPGLLVVAVLATGVAKVASGILAGRAYGLSPRRQRRVGLALIPRAEFSLIIATMALVSEGGPVLTETIPAFTVAYVLVLSILATLLMQSADRIEGWIGRGSP